MPIPKPKSGESKDDYISRCMRFQDKEGSDKPHNQQLAICYEQWKNKD